MNFKSEQTKRKIIYIYTRWQSDDWNRTVELYRLGAWRTRQGDVSSMANKEPKRLCIARDYIIA